MKVYLVYGLETGDFCNEPFVKKVFYDEQDAKDYVTKAVLFSTLTSWYIEEMTVE